MSRLRQLFARQDDPYAGADIVLARKMAGILCVLGVALTVLLWPLSPIDRQIGDLGWVAGAVIVAWGAAIAVTIRLDLVEWTFERFLVCSYLGVGTIAAMEWLAGGGNAPYENLMLLPMLFVSATNPARRVLPLLGAIALALAAPLAYNGWNGDVAAGLIATMVLWSALSFVIFTLMSGIRAQRIAMRNEEALAREQARSDELTGIGNRRAFEEAIADEVVRAGRMNVPLSVAMMDIVDFKRINDDWGHLEGDNCLRRVAEAISTELRAPDRCFRWGGDEFVLLLPGTNAEGAAQLAERLGHKVSAACRRPDDEAIVARFGAAELHDGMTVSELVESADLALLAARAGI
jgi:diguanylate cyclase (GGDEF)-like protein